MRPFCASAYLCVEGTEQVVTLIGSGVGDERAEGAGELYEKSMAPISAMIRMMEKGGVGCEDRRTKQDLPFSRGKTRRAFEIGLSFFAGENRIFHHISPL